MSKKHNPAWGRPNSPIGRINRKEYLISSVCLILYISIHFGIACGLSVFVTYSVGRIAGILVGLLFGSFAAYRYWQYLMLCTKRWHDMNLFGWLSLINFGCTVWPFVYLASLLTRIKTFFDVSVTAGGYALWILVLLLLIQLVITGTKGSNKYGPDPLEQK